MPNARYRKGYRNECRSRDLLLEIGYHVIRAGGSHGLWDLVAVSIKDEPYNTLLIQVKTNRKPSKDEMRAMRGFKVNSYTRKLLHLWKDGAKDPIVEIID